MTVEQIMQTINCTEEQAKGLLAHFATTTKAEQGIVTITARTIAYCAACGRREWHEAGECIECGAK